MARAVGDRILIAKTTAGYAHVCGMAPARDATPPSLVEVAALVDALADADAAPHVDRLSNLAMAEQLWDRYQDSVRHFRRFINIARASGQGHALPVMLAVEALSLYRRGRVAEANEASADALEASRLTRSPVILVWPLAIRCMPAGALDEALQLGQEAHELAGDEAGVPFPTTKVARVPGMGLSGSAVVGRRPPARPDGAAPRARGWRPARLAAQRTSSRPEVAATTALALGDHRQATIFASKAHEVAAGLPVTMPTVFARRASAAVAIADGDHERALTLAREATLAAEGAGARIERLALGCWPAGRWRLAGTAPRRWTS